MTSNPLRSRTEPQRQAFSKQDRCDMLNAERYTIMRDWFWFVKIDKKGNGEVIETIEYMDLPTGTKGWIRENQQMVKGLIRKITGGNPQLIEQVYQRAIEAALSPKSWNNRAE
jgi:hypothetical protein